MAKKHNAAKSIIATARATSDYRGKPWLATLPPAKRRIAIEARDEFRKLPPHASVTKTSFRKALCDHLGVAEPSHSTFCFFIDGRGES